MQINERGGFDVVIRNNSTGKYLGGFNIYEPEWYSNPLEARSGDDEDEMLDVALLYGFIDENTGDLSKDYSLVRIPWLDDDYAMDNRFYDANDDFDMKAATKFIFGNRDIYSVNEPDPDEDDEVPPEYAGVNVGMGMGGGFRPKARPIHTKKN